MFKNITHTFFTHIIIRLAMFGLMILNTQLFKTEGWGTIALITIDLSIVQLVTHLIGGPALVYLIPRYNFFQILFFSYVWMCISSVLGVLTLFYCKMIPEGFTWQLLILTFCASLFFISTSILQAREEVKKFNRYNLWQTSCLAVLFCFFVIIKKGSINYYLIALTISYFLLFCRSLGFIKIIKEDIHFSGAIQLLKEMFSYGIFIQLANLAQMFNYRISTFLIKWFIGIKWVGIYHAGNQLSEAVLAIPKSISLVQYARISNTENHEYSRKITLSLFKISGIFSGLAVLILCLIPASWLAILFGTEEFSLVKTVIYALAPGIVCLSCLSILSHYFAGRGDYWVNTVGSVIGLITVVTLGVIFIPQALKTSHLHALFAAAVSTSSAYCVNLVYTFIMFKIKTKSNFSHFIINKEDIKIAVQEIKKRFK